MNALELRRRTLGKGVYKKTVEGSPAIAQGSLARRHPGITMQGWTEQAQYEGKNLFDFKALTIPNDRTIIYNPIYLGDGTFTLSTDFKDSSGAFALYILPGNVQEGAGTPNGVDRSVSKTVVSSEGYVTVAYCRATDLSNPLESDIMLNSGSTALPYEPYTGGAPSPSPDYKQEITSAGKYDEETGKWEYRIEVATAQLFNSDGEYVTGTYRGYPINNAGQAVTITLYEKDASVDISDVYFGVSGNGMDTSDGYNWMISGGVVNKTKLQTTSGYITVFPGDNITKILDRYEVMVNFGNVSLPYQKYVRQTVTLTSERPLTKWDKLEKRNGQWGWVYKSAEVVLDGSEKWQLTGATSDEYQGFALKSSDYNAMNSNLRLVCDKFAYSTSDKINTCRQEKSEYGLRFVVSTEYVPNKTVAEFKSWLQSNPITVLYRLAEPVFVPLSASEQEQMNELYTFRPTTVLSNDCECEMSLTYKTKKSLEVTT